MKTLRITTGHAYSVWNMRAYTLLAHFAAAYGEGGRGSGVSSLGASMDPVRTIRSQPAFVAPINRFTVLARLL